jgi:hypothetical protein
MKRIIAAVIAATFAAATPVWAGHDHSDKRFWKEQKHREKEWRKAQKHAWKHQHREVIVQRAGPVFVERHVHYVEPQPVYYAPPAVITAPAAINIHIPIR